MRRPSGPTGARNQQLLLCFLTVLRSVRDRGNRKRLPVTIISILRNPLMPLAYRCLLIFIVKLSLYYAEFQCNLTVTVSVSL